MKEITIKIPPRSIVNLSSKQLLKRIEAFYNDPANLANFKKWQHGRKPKNV